MSQTYKQNNDSEDDKNECCICYNDNSEESNEGKLIECCPNKHILCVGCFHKSYEIKCECPLCRELMYIPEIMTDVEAFAYFGAKVELNDRREREEQQRQIRLSERILPSQVEERLRAQERAHFERQRERQRIEVERRRVEAEMRRQQQLEMIQARNVELLGQIAINNAEIENITNLDLDAYYAIMYAPYEVQSRTLQSTNLISSDSDSDTDDDSVEIIYEPQPRPVQQVSRPVARPVARPVSMQQQIHQILGRPVQQQQRRSPNYAREKLRQDEILVQTLNSHKMFLRYDRLNDRFIGNDNTTYPTLNSASSAHAEEMRLSYTPNAWKTFKRQDGSRIDNL